MPRNSGFHDDRFVDRWLVGAGRNLSCPIAINLTGRATLTRRHMEKSLTRHVCVVKWCLRKNLAPILCIGFSHWQVFFLLRISAYSTTRKRLKLLTLLLVALCLVQRLLYHVWFVCILLVIWEQFFHISKHTIANLKVISNYILQFALFLIPPVVRILEVKSKNVKNIKAGRNGYVSASSSSKKVSPNKIALKRCTSSPAC